MAKVITDSKHYSDIANAIRENNMEKTTYKPEEMAEAIKNLETRKAVASLNVYEYTGMFTIELADGSMQTGAVSFDTNGIATGLSDDSGNTVSFVNGYPTMAIHSDGTTVPIVWG